ncbi:Uncharacterized protein YR821_1227 [Yersinia ruckeri]|uniref:Uncharacterized protein n=1 Tax=Yersinia ruckeri TaxID=29486 RepID=A0A0A8VHH1_YERRU|nr:Uncharacterized protein YR821_1227 [Yersinia ruckeri]CEK27056.1 hypothetical protein CSF007_6495 [Yersinia ruckeri]
MGSDWCDRQHNRPVAVRSRLPTVKVILPKRKGNPKVA